MGSGRGRTSSYGPFSAAQDALHELGSAILKSAAQQGSLTLIAAAFPQFSPLIFAGYAAYQGFREFRDLRASYNQLQGSRDEKLIRLAASEGIKLAAGQVAGDIIDKPVDQAIELAVHNATDFMTQRGVFNDISRRAGVSQYSDDLRYFFMTTAESSLKGAYGGAKDQISKYVSEGVLA